MSNSEFTITIPRIEENHMKLNIPPGSSVIFVGANGSGKTRLAVFLEDEFKLSAHRISAHRALSLNPKVVKIDEDSANWKIRTGFNQHDVSISTRNRNRWNNNQATHLLNDFDSLLQVLFAEFLKIASENHLNRHKHENWTFQNTKFEKLIQIWEKLLPHRTIKLSGEDIQVLANDCQSSYSASELSDGERAIFYLIGQTLVAPKNCLLIIDEPELHVHKSLMSDLWDLLESERQDCSFVFITHDLDFAISRTAKKIVLLKYEHPNKWKLEMEQGKVGLDEKITTQILGSRKPILFVEGTNDSLDQAIYSACFPSWTIVPCGSCKDVVHSVITMNKHKFMNWNNCAGVIDRDDRELYDQDYLKDNRIGILPVAIIENLFLLPEISREIAIHEGYENEELNSCLQQLKNDIFSNAKKSEIQISIIKKYCKRTADHKLKRINFRDSASICEMAKSFEKETNSINFKSMEARKRKELVEAINDQDLNKLLVIYNVKGLLGILARKIRDNHPNDFKNWIVRYMHAEKTSRIVQSIKSSLQDVESTINKSK